MTRSSDVRSAAAAACWLVIPSPVTRGAEMCTSLEPQLLFDVLVSREPDAVVVAPSGELDISTSPLLSRALAGVQGRAAALGERSLVLDLSGLTFVDAFGVRLFVRAQKVAREYGHALV